MATKGFAAPEVEQAYNRARYLCRQIGETPQIFPVLYALSLFHFVRAEHGMARELGEQLLSLAQNTQDSALLLEAHRVLMFTLFWLGELTTAQLHVEQGLALYDPQQHSTHAFHYGSDPGVGCLYYASFILQALGFPDQAMRKCHAAIELAQRLSHPLSLASAYSARALLHQFRRDQQLTLERAETTIAFCHDQGIPFWSAMATANKGWALAEQGQIETGLVELQKGTADWQGLGARTMQPYWYALLAEIKGKAGDPEEGLHILADAIVESQQTGERLYEAELYRIKGELTLQKGAGDWGLGTGSSSPQAPSLKPQVPMEVVAEAEASFLKAIAIAQQQQAKSLELRATVSLARLWQQQAVEQGAGSKERGAGSAEQGSRTTQDATRAKLAEAHSMLSDVYNWFTEGFDTKDLQEAKTLLDELSA
jgi:predicted ATPase